MQRIIDSSNNYEQLDNWISIMQAKRILLVCGTSIKYQEKFLKYLDDLKGRGIEIVFFTDFESNPKYESVKLGVKKYNEEHCDSIMAIGGGSAMDVAKCIRLFTNMDENENYLEQAITTSNIPFLCIPTTAGTGSEATRFAVIYYDGEKQSVSHENCIPDTFLIDPEMLDSLPLYQRKATAMDALSHAIESYWSVNSNNESKKYSLDAIDGILKNMQGYIENNHDGNKGMLLASNLAGKAINITQTTAGHAMCYKLTSLFGISHGHAAILCNRVLFGWMIDNVDKCIDKRGKQYLVDTLDELGKALGGQNAKEGAQRLTELFADLNLNVPQADMEQYEILKNSVNPDRLKNFPIEIDEDDIDYLYHQILR